MLADTCVVVASSIANARSQAINFFAYWVSGRCFFCPKSFYSSWFSAYGWRYLANALTNSILSALKYTSCYGIDVIAFNNNMVNGFPMNLDRLSAQNLSAEPVHVAVRPLQCCCCRWCWLYSHFHCFCCFYLSRAIVVVCSLPTICLPKL